MIRSLVVPKYYEQFHCIASKCTDNCCIGWEIDIDPVTLEKYRSDNGPLTPRFLEKVAYNEESPHFILDEREYCPFLNKDHLCDIILEKGEEYLCQICSDHPRYYHWFSSVKEAGVGLSCEEAARLILTGDPTLISKPAEEEPLWNQGKEEEFSEEDIQSEQAFFEERAAWIKALDELDWNVFDFMELVFEWNNEENFLWDLIGNQPFSEELRLLIDFMLTLEINDDSWRQQLISLKDHIETICDNWKAYETEQRDLLERYRRLAHYFTFRYFMDGMMDETGAYVLWFILISVLVIEMMDIEYWIQTAHIDLAKQIEHAKAYSKEIEYCEENVQALEDYLDFGSTLSYGEEE